MTRLLPGVIAMAAIVLASNILVQFPMGAYLTWGAWSYPLGFLVGDLINRIQGPSAARKVVLAGFVTGIFCSAIGTQIIGDYGPLVTLRVAIASATGYLVSQMIDISIFTALRHGKWWKAPLVSTFIGSTLDTGIFFILAFSASFAFIEPMHDTSWAIEATPLLGFGPALPMWVSLAFADWGVKVFMALAALIPFKLLLGRLTTQKL